MKFEEDTLKNKEISKLKGEIIGARVTHTVTYDMGDNKEHIVAA